MDSLSPDRIRAIRALYADWWEGIRTTDPSDLDKLSALDAVTGALIGFLPTLLDEIEQLQAERTEGGRPRIRAYKDDSRWGNA